MMTQLATNVSRAIAQAQRMDRLYRVVEASRIGGELIKRIYHLGSPNFCSICPTACIKLETAGRVVFTFNPEFFDQLDDDQLIFVLLHESLHFALGHPRRRQDRLPVLWNIATDLVVNQFLLDRVGFSKNRSPGWRMFLSTAVTFENLGWSGGPKTENMTAEEAYELLEANLPQVQAAGAKLQACDDHLWSEGDGGSPEEADACGKNGCQNKRDRLQNDEDPVADKFDDIEELLNQIFTYWMPGWSPHGSGEVRQVLGVDPPEVDWERILVRRVQGAIQMGLEQRWAPPNRKIAWMFPSVLLPSDRELDRPVVSVLLALDASGSISPETLGRFMAIARTIPPGRAELATIVFDTVAYEADPTPPLRSVPGGGGTSFQCIEDHANGLSAYPGLIVVLTDGHAPRPSVRHPDRWFWLITEGGTRESIEGVGANCRIADVVR
jgi:predicted metal-dependent peptidase